MEGAAARKALSRKLSRGGRALAAGPVKGEVAEPGKRASELGMAVGCYTLVIKAGLRRQGPLLVGKSSL